MPKPITSLVNFFGFLGFLLGLRSLCLNRLFDLRLSAFKSWGGVVGILGALHLPFLKHLGGDAKLVHPSWIHLVDVTLVEEDEEDHIIPEATNAVHGWHLDHKGEYVVNEGVESLVCHHPPRKVSHALQLVVDEELGRHHDEAKGE